MRIPRVPTKWRRWGADFVRWVPWGWVTGGVLLVLAVLGPLFVLNRFATREFAYVWIIAIALIGLNILTGHSGQISLGNGAFMAIGAYTTAILGHRLGIPYAWTILPAGLLTGIAGYLFGFPALKLSGLYLALATFALALAVPSVIRNYTELTGGSEGISLPVASDPTSLGLTDEQWIYYLALVLLVPLFLFARAMLAGGTGRALRAMRDSETAATSSGVSARTYKTMAFGISAFCAGVAGSLYATATAYVGPDSFDLPLSLSLLVGIVVGGLGTLSGPILGAAFVIGMQIFTQQVSIKPDVTYGVILILVMFLLPRGIAGTVRQLAARVREAKRRRKYEHLEPVRVGSGSGDQRERADGSARLWHHSRHNEQHIGADHVRPGGDG